MGIPTSAALATGVQLFDEHAVSVITDIPATSLAQIHAAGADVSDDWSELAGTYAHKTNDPTSIYLHWLLVVFSSGHADRVFDTPEEVATELVRIARDESLPHISVQLAVAYTKDAISLLGRNTKTWLSDVLWWGDAISQALSPYADITAVQVNLMETRWRVASMEPNPKPYIMTCLSDLRDFARKITDIQQQFEAYKTLAILADMEKRTRLSQTSANAAFGIAFNLYNRSESDTDKAKAAEVVWDYAREYLDMRCFQPLTPSATFDHTTHIFRKAYETALRHLVPATYSATELQAHYANDMASFHASHRRWTSAARWYKTAAQLFAACGDTRGIARAKTELMLIKRKDGIVAEAEKLAAEVLEILTIRNNQRHWGYDLAITTQAWCRTKRRKKRAASGRRKAKSY